jgi:chromosome segregation ATPase
VLRREKAAVQARATELQASEGALRGERDALQAALAQQVVAAEAAAAQSSALERRFEEVQATNDAAAQVVPPLYHSLARWRPLISCWHWPLFWVPL